MIINFTQKSSDLGLYNVTPRSFVNTTIYKIRLNDYTALFQNENLKGVNGFNTNFYIKKILLNKIKQSNGVGASKKIFNAGQDNFSFTTVCKLVEEIETGKLLPRNKGK